MLANRVRMGSGTGNNDVSVNIIIKDSSFYVSPIDSIYIRPIIEGFELTPSDFDSFGYVIASRLNDIVSLYCGLPIALPRHSTINVTTLKSKYFILTIEGLNVMSSEAHLINRDVTVEYLSRSASYNSIFRLSKDLKDGDIINVSIAFD